MAHNFKITASRFVSKAGLDANNGFTADTAKKTIAALATIGAGQTCAIGAGQYDNDVVAGQFFGGATSTNLVADGKVIFRGTGTFVNTNGFRLLSFFDIQFENFSSALGGQAIGAQRCIFRDTSLNIWTSGTGPTNGFSNNVLINTSYSRRGGEFAETNINNCIWVKGGLADLRFGATAFAVNKCYFSPTTLLVTDRPALITNCNIQSTNITVNGTVYDSLAAARAADATWFPGCINSDPRFVNETTETFTLKADSPHLIYDIGPTHLRIGNGYYLQGPETEVTSSSGHYLENIITGEQYPIYFGENLTATTQAGQLRLKVKEETGGALTGRIRMAVRVADVPITLSYFNFAAGLNFNTDYPAAENLFDPNNPQVLNNNVVNTHNYTSGHAGRNPNRLDYMMRWSTKDGPVLATNSDWITGVNKLIFEWNTIPRYNPVTQYGNGSPEFKLAPTDATDTPIDIIATWVDFEIMLINNYYSK